ncbi:MAG TPA: lactate utilization protein C [Casimicrobiaceae bacterium]|nr:lactate utilization protein C [Casimicrobiaceae bacterium]
MDANTAAREAILSRIRKALTERGTASAARSEASRYVDAHARGPQPVKTADGIAQFVDQAVHMESTVERIATLQDIPRAVARYLDALELPAAIAEQRSHKGVCWPRFAQLDWRAAGLDIEARPTTGGDRLGITGCFCAIAETGTLVLMTGADSPTATALLPDTHIVVLSESGIVATMEDAFARARRRDGRMPRGLHLISGPSRTGDIEQTIVLGAHGPYRVHVLLLPYAC